MVEVKARTSYFNIRIKTPQLKQSLEWYPDDLESLKVFDVLPSDKRWSGSLQKALELRGYGSREVENGLRNRWGLIQFKLKDGFHPSH